MQKRIFLYPIDKDSIKEQNNNYVRQLIAYLGKEFRIINSRTEIGLLDALVKFRKTDIYYFNWIENLPAKRFGYLQVILLIILLFFSKLTNKKVVWFIHNNISHDRKHYRTKRLIVKLMSVFADLILSHSREIRLSIPKSKFHVFHHPIEEFQPLPPTSNYTYDLLIWGSVLPYKGIAEFVEFVSASQELRNYKIIIAGKFKTDEYHQRVLKSRTDNVTVVNEFVAEEELVSLFAQSRYVLFTYAYSSVLSSAALCKSLSFGKEIIAPNVGSFKELGRENYLFTFATFSELEQLLNDLKTGNRQRIDKEVLYNYIQDTSWNAFLGFVARRIEGLNTNRSQTTKQTYRKLVGNESS